MVVWARMFWRMGDKMKKLFIILALLLFPVFCFANPFLVSDPNENVEEIRATWNGTETVLSKKGDGSIYHDLSGIADGDHVMSIKACNMWGCSEAIPFEFTKAIPESVSGLSLSIE